MSPDSQGFTRPGVSEPIRLGTEGGLTMSNVTTNLIYRRQAKLLDNDITGIKNLTRRDVLDTICHTNAISLSEIAFQL